MSVEVCLNHEDVEEFPPEDLYIGLTKEEWLDVLELVSQPTYSDLKDYIPNKIRAQLQKALDDKESVT